MKKKSFRLILAVVLLLAVTPLGFSSPDREQIIKDWTEMDKLLEERDFFLYQHEFTKDPDAFIDKWLKFRETFIKRSAEFEKRYGSDRTALMSVFEPVSKPAEAKREFYGIVDGFLYADMEGMHKNIISWAEKLGSDNYAGWERLGEPDKTKVELKYRYAKTALRGYNSARRLNPDGNYSELIKKCENAEKESRSLYLKTLESIEWPGHNKDFEGPGKPDDLAKAALDFLQKNPKWSKPEYDDEHIPYAAAVTGKAWDVWKRAPITNQPTQYSLDILVAFTGTKDPDIVYVYNMTFYTAEEAGVGKELPFRYASSKQYQKYQMFKKAIPKGFVSASSVSKTDIKDTAIPSLSGTPFGIWRLVFSFILIICGGLGAKAVLIAKLPAVKPIIESLKPLYMPLGVILVLFGLVGFLSGLFRLAPHASLLPQAGAVLLGLIFIKRSPGPIPASIFEKIKAIEPFESYLGIACIVLGFLHLIIGGLPLF